MRKNILILILLITSISIYSQNDTTLTTRLNKPIKNCETIAFNSQSILPEYNISQLDSIRKILSIWENQCGNCEPIIRLKILLNIKQKTFVDTNYEMYIAEHIYIYKNRITVSKKNNYSKIFEYYKIYYSYVPLRSKFDEWTKTIAQNLLKEQKKGTSEYLLCLLFSEQIELFYDELKSKEYKENYVKTTVYDEKYETWQKGITPQACVRSDL